MKIRPLSRREFNNNIHIDKINKRMNKSRNNFSSFMRRNNYSIQNFYQTKVINHYEKPKLFSLLDINDKITNSRGTSIPKQYRRLTDKEQQRIFGLFSRYNNNGLQKRKFINRSAENIFPQNEINIKNNPKNSKYEFDNNRYKFKKYSFSQRNYKLNDINNTEISKNDEKNKNKFKSV